MLAQKGLARTRRMDVGGEREAISPAEATTAVPMHVQYAPPSEPPPPLFLFHAPPTDPPPARSFIPPPPPLPENFYDPRFSGLGRLRVLPDELLSEGVLARFLDAKDLDSLALVSRVFFVFSRDDQLWKALCLRKWALGVPGGGHVVFKDTWRETYYRPGRLEHGAKGAHKPPACPVLVQGFYSPHLYAKWQRCHMDFSQFTDIRPRPSVPFYIPPIPPPKRRPEGSRKPDPWPYPHSEHRDPLHDALTEVPREDGEHLTREKFVREYERKRLPVVISRELVKDWPALQKHRTYPAPTENGNGRSNGHTNGSSDAHPPEEGHSWSMDSLLALYPTTTFKIGNEYGTPRRVLMDLRDYADYMARNNDESPLYAFDPAFGEKCPAMLRGYSVPHIFGEDVFETLSNTPDSPTSPSPTLPFIGVPPSTPSKAPTLHRPDFRWLVLGPARSGASWHTDPLSTSAWNTLISGRKRWALYPPHVPYPPGVYVDPSAPAGANAKGMTMARWYAEVYPRLPEDLRPLEVVQEVGETVYVPGGWWHGVVNLDRVNVAVTQNWCGEGNLETVLREVGRAGGAKLFYHLRRHIVAQHPHLLPIFSKIEPLYFPVTRNPLVLSEGCRTTAEFKNGFSDARRWSDRVLDVIFRLNLLPPSTSPKIRDEDVRALGGGTNPVFLHRPSSTVVKFFSHLAGGIPAWANEVVAYARIAATSAGSDGRSLIPELVSFGVLDRTADGKAKWPWPYTLTRFLPEAVSLAKAMELARTEDGSDDWREERSAAGIDGREYQVDFAALAEWLGTAVRALHSLPKVSATDVEAWVRSRSDSSRESHVAPLVLENVRVRFTRFLEQQWIKAPARHAKSKVLPSRMVQQVADYLCVKLPTKSTDENGDEAGERRHDTPPDGMEFDDESDSDSNSNYSTQAEEEGENGTRSRVDGSVDWAKLVSVDGAWDGGSDGVGFLHGDLNPENIVGVWEWTGASKDGKAVVRFKPNSILDLGDSHHVVPGVSSDKLKGSREQSASLDPVFDFVPLFVGPLRSRRDLVGTFLASYARAHVVAPLGTKQSPQDFAARLTRYWVGWEFEGPIVWGVRNFGGSSGDGKAGRALLSKTFDKGSWTRIERGIFCNA